MDADFTTAEAATADLAPDRDVASSLTLLTGGPAPVAAPRSALGRWPIASWVVTDVVALLAASALVLAMRVVDSPGAEALGWALGYAAAVVAVLAFRGAYTRRVRVQPLEEAGRATQSALLAAMAVISFRTLVTGEAAGASETATLAVCAGVALAAGRAGLATALVRALKVGQVRRPTLILGAGKVGNLTAERLLANPGWGLDPVGFLDDDPLETPGEPPVVPVLGGPPDLDRILEEHRVEHFIVGFSMASHQLMLGLIRRCWEVGVSVSLVPRLFEIERDRTGTDRLGGLPLVSLDAPPAGGFALGVKYSLDRVVAATMLVLLAPVIAIVAALVKIVDGGAVLYRQHRVGRDGRHFVMLKFRTMVGAPERDGEADSQWADYAAGHAGVGASALDDAARPDRTTPLGHVLRRLSLDELPQLWNVLTGEMSMIGPRPERVRYAQRFEDTIYRYRDRHRVRSGITGWAQVNGLRGQTSLRDRVEADNYYIENWSLWLDLKIVLKTIAVLLRDVFTADHMKPLRRSAEEPTPSDTLAHRAAGSAP